MNPWICDHCGKEIDNTKPAGTMNPACDTVNVSHRTWSNDPWFTLEVKDNGETDKELLSKAKNWVHSHMRTKEMEPMDDEGWLIVKRTKRRLPEEITTA